MKRTVSSSWGLNSLRSSSPSALSLSSSFGPSSQLSWTSPLRIGSYYGSFYAASPVTSVMQFDFMPQRAKHVKHGSMLEEYKKKRRKLVREFKGHDILPLKWTPPPGWQEPPPETQISLHKRIRKKAKIHRVFPDVLPPEDLFTPLFPLKITYRSGVPVTKGTHISPSLVQEAPTVEFEKRKGKFYTLVMTSPDEPIGDTLPPSMGGARGNEFLHWLVVNIPENDMKQGETLCTYFPATPSQKREGRHRYVFLLFEQKDGKMEFAKTLAVDEANEVARYHFSTKRLKDEYNLSPSSLAFFTSSADGTPLQPQYEKLGIPYTPKAKPIQPSPHLDVTRW